MWFAELLLVATAAAGSVTAYRGGDGVFDATPGVLPEGEPTWSRPMRWSNAHPLVLDDRIVVLEEPSVVHALDRATGAVLWSRQVSVVDGLPAEDRAAAAALLAEAAQAELRLQRAQAAYGKLRRASRAGDAASLVELETLGVQMEADRAILLKAERYRLTSDPVQLGTTSATPCADGQRVYVSLGDGLVAALDRASGSLVWARWMGPPHDDMLGYVYGHATSPVLADGVLVVGNVHLHGLDPATGAIRWKHAQRWRHYGTPAVAEVGGRAWVVTPGGAVVRPSDGAVVLRDLPSVYYGGPTALGDRFWVVGGHGDDDLRTEGAYAAEVRLAPSGDGLEATVAWRTSLGTGGKRWYVPPVVHAGGVFGVDEGNRLVALDAGNGAVRFDEQVTDVVGGLGVPVVAGGSLWLHGDRGSAVRLPLDDLAGGVRAYRLAEGRAAPVFAGGQVVLRTWSGVEAWGTP